MGSKKQGSNWKGLGNGWYQLNERHCYIGINVFIVPYIGGRYTLRIVNPHNRPQSEHELSRECGQVDSVKTWKTPNGAKRIGWLIARRLDWLKAVGVEFKEVK